MAEYNEFELNFKSRYVKLLQKANKFGFNPEDLVYRGNEERDDDNDDDDKTIIKRKNSKRKTLFYFSIGLLVLFVSSLFSSFDLTQLLSSSAELITYTVNEFMSTDSCITSRQCIIPFFSSLTQLVLPPANCSLCRGLRRVEKVNSLSKEIFESFYAYSGRPVIVTDAMSNWTASDMFGFEFFANLYSEARLEQFDNSDNCQFFPYKTNFHNLSEVFHRNLEKQTILEGSKPWYIGWGNCNSEVSDILREHYSTPYFLPEGSESSRMDWIFMGSPGYGAHMHIDKVGNPSWQAQVRGSKLWTLVPPSECYFQCEQSIEVIVEKGELIVLDTNQWYHSTLIIGNETSITIGSEYD